MNGVEGANLLDALDAQAKVRWYVGGAVAGLSAAGVALVFAYTTFASSHDLSGALQRAEAIEAKAAAVETRTTRIEERQDAIRHDVRDLLEETKMQRAQLWEIAKTVGARQVAAPRR